MSSLRDRYRARYTSLSLMAAVLCASAAPALAWGDEGPEVVAFVARHYLRPAVLARRRHAGSRRGQYPDRP